MTKMIRIDKRIMILLIWHAARVNAPNVIYDFPSSHILLDNCHELGTLDYDST